MYHNINAGRLREIVKLQKLSNDTDEFGDSVGFVDVFEARADVKVKSGSQLHNYNTTMTSSIVTVLMWYDERAQNDQVLLHRGVRYTVKHVKPDENYKSMILTCEVIKK